MSRKQRASRLATGRALRDLAKEKLLPPGSPGAKRRDELLGIMNDETRSLGDRLKAAQEAAPLCYVKRAVVVPAEASDLAELAAKDYDLEDDHDFATLLLAEHGLVVKTQQ